MGAGASSSQSYELTSQQKAHVARAVQERYVDLHQQQQQEKPTQGEKPDGASFESELFESLKSTYHEAVAKSLRMIGSDTQDDKKSKSSQFSALDADESKPLPLPGSSERERPTEKGGDSPPRAGPKHEESLQTERDSLAGSKSERGREKESKSSDKSDLNMNKNNSVVSEDNHSGVSKDADPQTDTHRGLPSLTVEVQDDCEYEKSDLVTPLPVRRSSSALLFDSSKLVRSNSNGSTGNVVVIPANSSINTLNSLLLDERDHDPVRDRERERNAVRERHRAVERELERTFSLLRGRDSDSESEDDTVHFALSSSLHSVLPAHTNTTISSIEGPDRLLKARTSVQLLSLVNDASLLDDQARISSFLSQLRAGEVATKQQSNFRQRRLTYEKEHNESGALGGVSSPDTTNNNNHNHSSNTNTNSKRNNNDDHEDNDHHNDNNKDDKNEIGRGADSNAYAFDEAFDSPLKSREPMLLFSSTAPPALASPPPSLANSQSQSQSHNNVNGSNRITASPAQDANASFTGSNTLSSVPRLMRSRTTIFASGEIGVTHVRTPPFPDDVLGTYSCHGIEPAPDEADGIHEKINQDRGCVVHPYNNSKTEALFMVLDGHGEQGDKVSEFVMRQIVVSLEKDSLLSTEPVSALKNAFITTNTALLVTNMNYMTSGTTCVAVYLRDNTLFVANCGDSRAIMAHREKGSDVLRAKALTRDHKPDDPDEQDRIQKWGGFVCPPHEEGLSARVYLDAEFTMIGLAMARSIGDHAVKNVGVIAEPEVKVFDLQPEDEFLIIASDGVWEFVSNEEAVEAVQESIKYGVNQACQDLIELAAGRWQEVEGDYRDDITAIVVKFPLPGFPSL